MPGPTGHQGHALPTLVDPRLALAQRGVVGGRFGAGPLSPILKLGVSGVTGLDLGDLVVIGGITVNVASVVRVEDEDGVLGQAQFVELGQHPPEALIDAFQHGGHDGVALLAPGILLLGKLLGVFLLVAPWPVDSVVPKVEIKGLILIHLDEGDGLVG